MPTVRPARLADEAALQPIDRATWTRARRLYEACGFVAEGVLRGEFHLDGRDVDDVLMARYL